TKTASEKEIVERAAQLGLDKGVVERAVSAFSTLRHTVAKEQIENAVLELQLLASYVQAMKTAIYKMALEEASRAWYEERDPAALWALAILGAKETGKGSNKIFKDEDDKLAYLIASFTLLSHLKEFVELKERIYRELWALERAVKNGEFTLGEIWGHFEILAEAERKAGEVANKLNSIAYELETIGLSEIAEQLRVTIEKVIELVEASERELVTIKATRGERAVATLLSLVNGGLIGATIERALSVRGKHVVGALSVASAVRSAPYGFYLYFLTSGNREELSETRRIALRIVSLLSDPLVREMLNWRQDIKIRSEEKVEEDKRHVYVTFVDREGHILLKVIWEISRKIRPLKVEGEIVDIFREVANSVDAILSGSKPLVKLSEEGKKAWERATTAVREVKRVIKGMAKIITIGVLPTDASLRIGYKSTGGESSSLSQAFTYYAMTDGKVSVEKIYPSEEGLKAKWYVVGRYEEVVNKILDEGYKSLKSLSNKMPDPDLLFSDINISKEFKRTLTDAAGEFRHRVTMLLNEWDKAKELKDVKTLNKLGKYLRVLLPLAYLVDAYRQGELSSEEVALAIIFAVLYDGTIYRNEIWFSVGDPEQEENPIISREHFTVFWLWALKELGFRPSAVHFGYEAHIIVFRNNELYNLLKALNPALPKLYELRNTLAEFAEAFRVVSRELVKNRFSINWAYEVKEESFFKKLERVIAMVENYTSANQNNRK
ncbi:PaRep2b protein, partial [Pyrobaculum aerophilum]|uniref:PaRep2b protein n=1 Tax=Pyrobaculum aerophilum TaxID=13773 RepID=UPI002FD95AB5